MNYEWPFGNVMPNMSLVILLDDFSSSLDSAYTLSLFHSYILYNCYGGIDQCGTNVNMELHLLRFCEGSHIPGEHTIHYQSHSNTSLE